MPPKTKVILIEDHKPTLKAARKALVDAGHQILFDASDYQTAEMKLASLNTEPEVALVDCALPNDPYSHSEDEILGPYIASLIAKRFPQTTIVFFSDREEQTFGKYRFPEAKEWKGSSVIEKDLGNFVTRLPIPARR